MFQTTMLQTAMLPATKFKSTDAYIVGYYGMQNSGDDALMYATAWGANKYLSCDHNKIGLYGDHNRHTPATQQLNLNFKQSFPGQNRLAHYKAAIKSKRIIFGGGAVLHSTTDINLKRHLMSLASPEKSRAVGVSIGPFQSVAAEKACARFLNECAFVGVRDANSLAIANSIAPQAKVEKTFDLAPLLLCANKFVQPSTPRKGIALALCSVAIDPMGKIDLVAEQQRLNQLCQLITTLYNNTGEAITLIEFNGHSVLGDWVINNAIKARLSNKIPLIIKPYNPNPFAVMNDLASYKALISMRLHGSILGYLAKTPVLSINYHQKCAGWCQQIGLAESYQLNIAEQQISQLIEPLEQGLTQGFIAPKLPVSVALNKALLNWSTSYE